VTVSLSGSTSTPEGGETSPFTRTDPEAISSSAPRLLATPDRARKRFSLSNHAASKSSQAREGRLRQVVQRLQAHHVQKSHRRAIELRLSGPAAAADL